MRKNKTLIIIIFLYLLASFAVAHCRENKPGSEFEAGSWQYKPTGSFEYKNAGFDCYTNLKNNGNFHKKTMALAAYKYSLGAFSDVRLSYNQMLSNGTFSATAINNVMINNVVFGAGGAAKIEMDLRMNSFDLYGSRELGSGELGYIDFLYGARFFDMTLKLKDSKINSSNVQTRKVALPSFGFSGFYNINGNLNFYCQMAITNDSASSRSYIAKDVDLGLAYQFKSKEPDCRVIGPNVSEPETTYAETLQWFIQLGYKEKYLKETNNSNVMVLRHNGPQIKALIKF